MIIGLVHDRNAWVMNNYYLASSVQNFLGCNPSSDQTITLSEFLDSAAYHISWFPTHLNSGVHPLDTVWTSSGTGTLLLDLSTAPLGYTIRYYLDTLHADYAFIITPQPFHRSFILPPDEELNADTDWDFILYPNPAHDQLILRFTGYDAAPNPWYTLQWSQIERTLDGNCVVLATLGQSAFPYFYRPFLMKTDQNGDTLWTRSVGDDDYIYYTRDLLVASDGGFLFSGIVWGDLPENNLGLAYIIKADSLGHFPCSEQVQPIQILDLFPTDSSFTLTSIDGATMMPAFVSDTLFDPLAVYDACEIFTGVVPVAWPPRQQVSVRPNPTTGRFTVRFADPLLAASYYSVYDPMGRLLYQRPLPQGAQSEEIDLSRFGQGTYLLKFTDRTEVCYQRVVVQ